MRAAALLLISLAGTAARAESPVAGAVVQAEAGVIRPDLLDDFNDGNSLNFWAGGMGIMPDDSIAHVYDTTVFFGAGGRSLRLDYNTAAPGGQGWNGFWIKLNLSLPGGADSPADLSAYRRLSFQVRGAPGALEHMKVQLTNASANPARRRAHLYVHDYLDGGVTDDWRQVVIPLDAFHNLDSLSNATELAFVFERAYAESSGFATAGTIYVDDVTFSLDPAGPLRIDHFGDNWGWGALGGNTGDLNIAPHSYQIGAGHNHPWGFRSEYDVRPGNPDYAGHFFIFGGGNDGWAAVPANLSRYRWIQFYVKALANDQNPESFKLEIQSGVNKNLVLIISNVITDWRLVRIDLDNVVNPSDLDQTAIKQMNIIYERNRAVDGKGVLFFDEFEFTE